MHYFFRFDPGTPAPEPPEILLEVQDGNYKYEDEKYDIWPWNLQLPEANEPEEQMERPPSVGNPMNANFEDGHSNEPIAGRALAVAPASNFSLASPPNWSKILKKQRK